MDAVLRCLRWALTTVTVEIQSLLQQQDCSRNDKLIICIYFKTGDDSHRSRPTTCSVSETTRPADNQLQYYVCKCELDDILILRIPAQSTIMYFQITFVSSHKLRLLAERFLTRATDSSVDMSWREDTTGGHRWSDDGTVTGPISLSRTV